jgi:predicted extracellular nuclease
MIAAGYENLEKRFDADATTFVFDGFAGTLDYAFASGGLSDDVTGAEAWEINSAEPDAIDYNRDFDRDPAYFDGTVPFRTSDHDPLIVGLDFGGDVLLV